MEPEAASKDESDAADLAFVRLLHLSDSALPIGGLAHSFGLESLVSESMLWPGNLAGFLRGYLEEAGRLESVFCRESFRSLGSDGQFSVDRWIFINDLLSALKPARESRAGSAALGRHLLLAASGLGDYPALQAAREAARQASSLIHHSPAFGLTGSVLGLDEDRSVLGLLHQSTASLVSACQRLLPLGQTEATRLLWELKPVMIDVARWSARCALDDISCSMPLLDWGAMEHPALSTRLFIS